MTLEAKVVELRRHVIQRVAAGGAGEPSMPRGRDQPRVFYAWKRRYGLRTRWERLARLEGAALATLGLVTERSAREPAKAQHMAAERPGDLVCLDASTSGT